MLESILAAIGDTPLIALDAVLPPELRARGVTIWGKAEHLNPGGSLKDRIALSMIEAAERNGRLAPGGTIIEPTSGNTGIGLALVCANKGYRLVLTMPESMSLERRTLLQALGAELVLTPAEASMDGAVQRARALCGEHPDWLMPQQFDNPANPEAHRSGTAAELLSQLGEAGFEPAAFVAGVGTGGTISGVGPLLRGRFPRCRVIAVEPSGSPVLEGGVAGPHKIQGIGAGFVPMNFDRRAVDEIRAIDDATAWAMKRRLACECGLLVGISSGANVAVALEVAADLTGAAQVVTVLCDTGERYFSLDEYFFIKEPEMATVRIPTPLRKYTQGQEEVAAAGKTVGELIADLEAKYPGIKERICDDKGALRRFVNVFVKDEDVRFLKNLETPVADSDEVSIVPAIAGGAR